MTLSSPGKKAATVTAKPTEQQPPAAPPQQNPPASTSTLLQVELTHVQLTLSLPPEEPANHYRERHLDCQLDAHQARAMRRITRYCEITGATLRSGTKVNSSAMSLRWLLEQIEDAAG